MIDLKRVKLALFDFDDTLAIHTEHCWNSGLEQETYESAVNGKLRGEKTLLVHEDMQYFIDLCKEKGIKMGLISATGFSPVAEVKCDWVKRKYDADMHNYCVGNISEKVRVMVAIAEALGYEHEEILIVDDYFDTLSKATRFGFQTASPIEVSAYVKKENHDRGTF